MRSFRARAGAFTTIARLPSLGIALAKGPLHPLVGSGGDHVSQGCSLGLLYELDGERIERLPAGTNAQERLKPIYETHEGWSDTTRGARTWAELPAQAVKYVRHIEELIECPVTLLSTSPEREDTILVRDPFED